MSEWMVAGVLLGIFALVAPVGSRAWRGAYLEKLSALEGEQTLFEEQGIRVDSPNRPAGRRACSHSC